MMNFEHLLPLSNELCLRLALTLLHFLWQGLLVGAAAMLGARLLRTATASTRYMVFTTALLLLPVCVVITFQCIELPPSDILTTSEHSAAVTTVEVVAYPDMATPYADVEGESVPYNVRKPADFVMPTKSEPLPVSSGTQAVAVPQSTTEAPASNAIHWATYLVAGYLIGVAVFLLRLLLGVWGGHRLRHAAQAVDNALFLQVLACETKRMGLWMTPALGY